MRARAVLFQRLFFFKIAPNFCPYLTCTVSVCAHAQFGTNFLRRQNGVRQRSYMARSNEIYNMPIAQASVDCVTHITKALRAHIHVVFATRGPCTGCSHQPPNRPDQTSQNRPVASSPMNSRLEQTAAGIKGTAYAVEQLRDTFSIAP